MKATVSQIKTGKAAGVDGIYPEMIRDLGGKTMVWLAAAMADTLRTIKYPDTHGIILK